MLKGKCNWVGEDRTTHSSRVSSRVWPARTAEAQAWEAPAWELHPPHVRALLSALSVTAHQVTDIAFSYASWSCAEKLWSIRVQQLPDLSAPSSVVAGGGSQVDPLHTAGNPGCWWKMLACWHSNSICSKGWLFTACTRLLKQTLGNKIFMKDWKDYICVYGFEFIRHFFYCISCKRRYLGLLV